MNAGAKIARQDQSRVVKDDASNAIDALATKMRLESIKCGMERIAGSGSYNVFFDLFYEKNRRNFLVAYGTGGTGENTLLSTKMGTSFSGKYTIRASDANYPPIRIQESEDGILCTAFQNGWVSRLDTKLTSGIVTTNTDVFPNASDYTSAPTFVYSKFLGKFVFACQSKISTSDDGIAWTSPISLPFSCGALCSAESAGLLIAFGNSGITTSPDAVTWSPVVSVGTVSGTLAMAWSDKLSRAVINASGWNTPKYSGDLEVWNNSNRPVGGLDLLSLTGKQIEWIDDIGAFVGMTGTLGYPLVFSEDAESWDAVLLDGASSFSNGGFAYSPDSKTLLMYASNKQTDQAYSFDTHIARAFAR